MFIVKYLKSYLYIFISIFILAIIIGTLNYFNILSSKITNIFEIISRRFKNWFNNDTICLFIFLFSFWNNP